jgi:pimeloyl-ACP methyl ester carboxylesterase
MQQIAASRPFLVLLPGMDGIGKSFRQFSLAMQPAIDTSIVTYPVDEALDYAELEHRARGLLPKERPFFLLAESFSGPIAARIAADPPRGLLGTVFCATFVKNPYPMLGWAAPFAGLFPFKSLPRWVRAPLMWGSSTPSHAPPRAERATSAVDDRVLRHRIATVLAVDETAAMATIALPTLIVSARSDRVIPRAATMHMLRTLPHARHVELDGPHLVLQTRPAICATIVTEFLKEHAGREEPPCQNASVSGSI